MVVVVRARLVGHRQEVLDRSRNGTLEARGDRLVFERKASGAILIPGVGVVDHVRVGAEVAHPLVLGRHFVARADARDRLRRLVVTEEEEQLVLDERAADGAAEVLEIAFRLGGGEEGSGAQAVVVEEVERRPMQFVGARFRDHRGGSSAGEALLRITGSCRDRDRFDRLGRGDVARVVRQPHVDAGRAVDARHVVVPVRAVYVGAERPRRRVQDRILEPRRSGSGHEVDQALVVPEVRQRKGRDRYLADFRTRVGLLGLQLGGGGFHRDLFGDLSEHQPHIDARDRIGRDGDVFLDVHPEAVRRDGNGVDAGLHVHDAEQAERFRRRDEFETGLDIDGLDIGARHDGAGRVGHGADERAVQHLGRCRGRPRHGQRGQ